MSRSTKALIGVLSFLPIILLIAFFVLLIGLFPTFFEWDKYDPEPAEMIAVFAPLFFIGIIMGLLSLGLLIFFIIHLLGYKTMDPIEKVVWVLVFIFVGIVGYPIYWYMRVWNDDRGAL